ncbi:Cytosolic chaperonin Cct ring complex subunit theta [Komagataella phaffii CBS 7435]|uniref:CCT-theta n=2 Tax=Komagataella phaffii TaxID=460519 RepID=C4R455_KOMPG|nr:Subunit of the cytosolic chaperonin Cct ring complex, related to Tcp1p [Komagataella phaffii GS115]AOA63984.1 GQ67_03358T0 [Komagataella phaffii]CAH2449912.1 Cytosolic chaperonin Cct ring complex subunit theta [Komagataella phaffii CBS 7435]AOA69357.1 GQ68_03327T0 [Komagataella phaffii GS115]CAY70341.1 Subunit of the cytosolic chaperonin Cct ring complex, related to Tcp1p [Komagataella phaffii GS115]CCA39866.1 Cytosolic chaperonin Cct ring complex subunit theta [Komagataella phaffii CBS 743
MSSLKLPSAPNSGLFKQGYQTQSNADGAINRNIQACREISSMVATSIGPCGKNKIIVNHLQKIIITNDAATMLRELDVVHPAVKVLVMASDQQEREMGDNSNYVLVFAGELLSLAEKLVILGLTPTEIIQGYTLANKFALKELESLVVDQVDDVTVKSELLKIVKPIISSKQFGSAEIISELVTEAVLNVLPRGNPQAFNVDSVRVVKIMGSSLESSFVLRGMVFPRPPDSHVKSVKQKSKVAVFTCPIDITTTETKGTVLLHNAQEMLDFSKGEEQQLDTLVKEIHDSGVRVIIAGAGVGELALHYLDRYGLLVIKVPSKFDLRRVCRVCGATPSPRLGALSPEELGEIDVVETTEIGSDQVTVFKQDKNTSSSLTSTIVIRGATQNNLDDIERAIDDGVSAIKGVLKDSRLLPGAGAVEAELVRRVTAYGEKTPGLLQLAIKKFAEAFEFLPRTIADTAGLDTNEVIPKLYAAHTPAEEQSSSEGLSIGINIEAESLEDSLVDISNEGIYDLFISKKNAIDLATEAVNTVLSVDQIIVAKRAGGPVMPQQPRPGNWDQAD